MTTTDKIHFDIINNSTRRKEWKKVVEKYQPKVIREYEENGHIVKVYETR